MRIAFVLLITCMACGQTQTSEQETDEVPVSVLETTADQSNDPYIRLYNEGYHFYATGNEPFWNLAINFDKEMKFYRMEGKEIVTPIDETIRAQDANVIMYRGKSDSGTLAVTVNQTLCSDTMSDEERPFKVSIRYIPDSTTQTEFKELTGCGNYLADPRIHNIWGITAIDGNSLSPDDFPNGMPRIELFTRDGRVLGFDGCNTFRGTFYVKDGEFYFGALASTLMACENADVGAQIGSILHFSKLKYEFQDSSLILTAGDHSIALKPID